MATCTVLVLVYNHSSSIVKALESVYVQQCSFDFNVLIYDDYSSDSTLDLVEKYFDDKPHFLNFTRIVKSPQNNGITKSYQIALNLISEDYVAILEGDDYWVNIFKLQKQLSILEQYQNFVGCTSNYLIQYKSGKISSDKYKFYHSDSFQVLTVDNIISDYSIGNFSCAIYRMSAINQLDKSIYDLQMYDWLFNVAISEFGPFIHINEPLSVYNYSGTGEWSKMTEIDQNQKVLSLIPGYKEFFSGRYNTEFETVEKILMNQINSKKNEFNKSLFSKLFNRLRFKIFK